MEVRRKQMNRSEGTDLACWKQNKTTKQENKTKNFGEHSAFQPCLKGIYEVEGEMLGEREKVFVLVFKLISRINIVIKFLEFKFLLKYFTMENIF